MIRTLFCAAVALVLAVGNARAEDKKPDAKKPDAKPEAKKPEGKPEAKPEKKPEGKPGKKRGSAIGGMVKKFDAASGALTVAVKVKKGETTDKEVKLPAGIKVVVFSESGEKKEGSDGLKELKEGARVTVFSDADGKVVGVAIGTPQKKKK